MKKVFAALLLVSWAHALPVLNPGLPALMAKGVFLREDHCWDLRYSYRGDYTYNAKLKEGFSFPQQMVDSYSLYTNAGVLTLSFANRVDLYGVAGATTQTIFAKEVNTLSGATRSVVDLNALFETRPSWGVGLRLLLWQQKWRTAGTSFLGAGFEYFTVLRANSRSVTIDKAEATAGTPATTQYYASQYTLAFAQRVQKLSPYVALKWANQRARMVGTPQNGISATSGLVILSNLKSQRRFGWACGVTLIDFLRMNITAEARFVNESACTLLAEFRW
jgi:hypothetical protein